MTIKNPVEWGWAQLGHAAHAFGSAHRSLQHIQDTIHSPAPVVRRIALADLKYALAKGFDDFGACRTDVMFLCVIYPVVGLILARIAFGAELVPLLFPLASGFTLVGPFVAVGLYEMSRERERGRSVTWGTAFEVLRAPAAGAIAVLGSGLVMIFLAWLATAWAIYQATLGPALPVSAGSFLHDVFATAAGHRLILLGVGAGFLFAVLAMAISIVSFPLLLDRDVGLDTAIETSFKAVIENPLPMAVWGLIVAGSLLLGTLPFFIGLVVVMPVLGHTTWHLYRRLVA